MQSLQILLTPYRPLVNRTLSTCVFFTSSAFRNPRKYGGCL
nr:MAG TPA: hypothetical protein [Caudoviricetes sp.]